ncbi:hypothetical protein K470DRAFT_255924 [Piedraia hortae CBS 480.64]|uniref:Uncharacterized protein n=1 Tax=Piedraia hortae CBS 480.64 TaxID=1314780 RepID=A0A6A7C5I5_9PEZI|nr:hypothetical protein K470DRAFT_255924 [Piedraia hortae CBS 480.64]
MSELWHADKWRWELHLQRPMETVEIRGIIKDIWLGTFSSWKRNYLGTLYFTGAKFRHLKMEVDRLSERFQPQGVAKNPSRRSFSSSKAT